MAENKVLFEFEVNGKKIQIVRGDITVEDVDAIVNAANSYLKHGGGVAGAIVRRGGYEIQKESDELVRKHGAVPVGKAVYTGGGKLKARYVIHTVGPRWGEGNEVEKLRSAIRSALEVATQLKLKSISLPAVSTGIFGFPKDLGAKVITEEVVNFLKTQDTTLEVVRLCNIDELTSNLFLKEAERISSESP
ncbi:MAG: macro domain-containing protein [Candidatus Hydrothermota bacterium]|nr:MAG: macro domain-containing protein [Candidatus Hydrothermae bacterium]